jgi:hypothetical protein
MLIRVPLGVGCRRYALCLLCWHVGVKRAGGMAPNDDALDLGSYLDLVSRRQPRLVLRSLVDMVAKTMTPLAWEATSISYPVDNLDLGFVV